MTDDLVTLHLHDRDVDALAAARRVPRCDSCRHHPNAHGRSGCTVIVDGKVGGKKCGCAAMGEKARRAA